MDSELLTWLLKFIEYLPDYLSALSVAYAFTLFLDNLCRNSCMHIENAVYKVKEKWFHSIVGVLDANTCRAEYYNKKIETVRTVTRVSRTKRSSDCAVRGGWNTI